jgi:hypothetical protein
MCGRGGSDFDSWYWSISDVMLFVGSGIFMIFPSLI